jgi:hypothetical protein
VDDPILPIIGIIIVGMLCGMATMAIAENRGNPRSANLKWFVTGFFLGIFGVIIALISPKKTEGFVETGKMIVCPFCKEHINAEATVCRYCQSKLV